MRLFLLVVVIAGLAGCLGVDSPDGSLRCSSVPKRACPEGFYCLPGESTCWRVGHYPVDMAKPQQLQGGGPPVDMSIPVEPDDLSMTAPSDLSDTD